MSDNELIEDLKEKISNIEERIKAIEKERMQHRLLENAQKE